MQARDGLFVSRIPPITLSDGGMRLFFVRPFDGTFLSQIGHQALPDFCSCGERFLMAFLAGIAGYVKRKSIKKRRHKTESGQRYSPDGLMIDLGLCHIHARITFNLRELEAKTHEGSGKMLAIPCPSPLFRKHGLAEELEWAWDRTPLRVDKIGCGFAKQFQDA